MDTVPTIIVLIKREFDTFHWGGLRLCTLYKDAFPECVSAWFIRVPIHHSETQMPPSLGHVTVCKGVSCRWRAWASRHSLVTQVDQCSDQRLAWTTHVRLVRLEIYSRIAALPPLFLCSPCPVPGVWSQTQPFPANAVQVDKTVAEPESLKKLLIIWLMCIRLWAWEINRQPWAELLKWVLVLCLLSLGNGFSCLHHPVNRCRDAVFSLSQSQEQPVARRCLLRGPAAWAVCNMDSPLLRTFQLLETVQRDRSYPDFPSIPHACTCACTCPPDIHTWTHTYADSPKCT